MGSSRSRRYGRLSMVGVAAAALALGACRAPQKEPTKPKIRAIYNCVAGAVQETQPFVVPDGVTLIIIGATGGQGGDG